MSRVLRLYPRSWRTRYGAELASILEARPASFMDRVDLVRGALDAHLHPELVDRDADAPATDRTSSALAGLLIGLGSVIWLAGVVTVASQPLGFGDRDARMFGWLVPFAGLVYAVGIARLDASRRVRRPVGIFLIAAFSVAIVPMVWPIAVFGYYGLMFALAGVAVARARSGFWPSWLAALIAGASVLGVGTNTATTGMWLAALPALAMAMLATLGVLGRLPAPPAMELATEGGRA